MPASITICTQTAKQSTSSTNTILLNPTPSYSTLLHPTQHYSILLNTTPSYSTLMKWSNILLYSGLAVLLAGAVMSMLKLQPYSDYVLIAGALLVIFRGAVKSRENNS